MFEMTAKVGGFQMWKIGWIPDGTFPEKWLNIEVHKTDQL